MVFHLAAHPYWNQLWGTFTVPFSIVAGQAWLRDRDRRTLIFFLGFLLVGLFAYPLMAPFPLGAVFFMWLIDRIERKRRGEQVEPLRLPRRVWAAVPLVLLLAAMIVAVVVKFVEFIRLLGDTKSLTAWQGDLFSYPPVNQFFGIARQLPAGELFVAAVVAAGAVGLWRAPRRAGAALIPVLVAAGAMALWFRHLPHGQYVYFKILAFTGPLVLVACVAALGRLRRLGALAIAGLVASSLLLARDEIRSNYDQLTPETIELQGWAKALPANASIRLDTPSNEQIWQAYMLHARPTGSKHPLIFYPHVQFTDGADYALDMTLFPPPPDRAGNAPLRRNAAYRLWKLRAANGPDTTSRAQSNAAAPPGSLSSR
jgi:MFS family permease